MGIPWYQLLVRPLLFRLPPEYAQRVAEAALAVGPAWRAVGALTRIEDPVLSRTVAGLPLRCPIGLAAGFDKQCRYLGSLGQLGFGYLVENPTHPLHQFNYAKLHISCLKNWRDSSKLILALEELGRSGGLKDSSLEWLLEQLREHSGNR